MTVIAWDGKVLAADKRASNAGLIRTATKIYRVNDSFVAFDGDLDQGLLMLEWVRNGCIPDEYPESQSNEDRWANVIVADKGGLRQYQRTHCPIAIEDKIFASGSGRDFALAAMHCGKTAVEAVEIASVFQSDCGNGCDYYEV